MSEPAPIKSGRASDATESLGAAPLLSLQASAAVWALILSLAAGSLAFFYSRGLINLYGDGLAHLEGARRIFDSLTPGYQEIGRVWLPLFHLMAAPLALNDFLWRSGLAGSLISTAAFALTGWFLFRLGLEMNRTLAAGILALAAFLLCPNMAYLASTPLTEPLAQLWMVLAVYGLHRFKEGGRTRALVGSGVAACLGTLTRYDGWYLLPFATLFVLLSGNTSWSGRLRQAALFSLLVGWGPLLWLLHNLFRFGNPIDFYNGPYSARAIYAHQLATTAFPYPTEGSLWVSARYYLEDLKLVIGAWPLVLAALGLIAWVADRSQRGRRSAALLLLVPLPFYLHSLAFAAVPLYVPTLFPNTYYNLRYGLQMLPAVAIFSSFLLGACLPRKTRHGLTVILLGIVAGQTALITSGGARELVVVREGIFNTPCRSKRQQAIVTFLRDRYDGGTILMAAGKWPCVMPELGIPFRKTLSETNRAYWLKLPTAPEEWVEWIIRGDGDTVDQLMRAYPQSFEGFELLRRESFPKEGSVAIYRRRGLGPQWIGAGSKPAPTTCLRS